MVKIISDSTCDLTPDLLSKYDIDILPLHILLGEKEYKDGINITPDQIYSWSDANKTTPKTSAPALSETIELFRPYVEEGRNIVCFSISNSMSSSGNVMQLAAEELNAQDLITVIDSANLSTGIGLLVIEAAILAQNNKTAAEISVAVESLKPYVRASFVVDTLTYLHRGRTLQRHRRHGRRSFKAPPPDHRRARCHETDKKIPGQNGFRYSFLCERYGTCFKACASGSRVYHTFRL